MKNLMNRVLVALAISAVFAGNVDASQKRQPVKSSKTLRMEAEMSQQREELSKLGFFDLVNKMGGESFGLWTEEARREALIAEYGSLDKPGIKNLKLFLLGSDTNKTMEFRAKYKEAALKELATKAVVELTKEVKEDEKNFNANPTPEKKAELEAKTGLLASMVSTVNAYVPASALTAAKALIGGVTVTLLIYGGSFAIDYAAAKVGIQGEYGKSFRTYVSDNAGVISNYVTTSRPAAWLGSAYGTAQYYGGQVVGAAKAAPGAALGLMSAGYYRGKRALGYETPVVNQPAQ